MDNLHDFRLKNKHATFMLKGRVYDSSNLTDAVAKKAMSSGLNIFTFQTSKPLPPVKDGFKQAQKINSKSKNNRSNN